MSRPAYFVVSRVLGRETPAIWWDELPREPIRNLVYVLRLDEQPDAERLLSLPLDELFSLYWHLKRAGKLPPRWEPPPRPKTEPAKVRLGDREVHPRRYLPDPPYDPHA